MTLSDHLPLIVKLNTKKGLEQKEDQEYTYKPWIRYRYPQNEHEKQAYIDALISEDCTEKFQVFYSELDQNNQQVALNELMGTLNLAIGKFKKHYPFNKKQTNQPPWWDKELELLKKDKYKSLDIFQRTGTDVDRKAFLKIKQKFKNTYRSKQDLFLKAKYKQVTSIDNVDTFWKELKKCRPKANTQGISGQEWEDYFKRLLGINPPDNEEILQNVQTHDMTCDRCQNESQENDLLDANITEDEVTKVLKDLPKNKTPGEDGIENEFFTAARMILTPILTALFNSILKSGVYPEEWSRGTIYPIHKKGSVSNPNNFRGITLLSSMSKICSTILNNILTLWCQTNYKLSEEQCGFRKGYSTIDNIFTLMACAQKYLCKRKGRFYIIFVDFSKAFDTVVHTHLWHCLMKNGIHGKFLCILRSMYANIRSNVKTDNGLTETFKCFIGTRQGDIISPLLFILYLNEYLSQLRQKQTEGIYISEDFPQLCTLMYADDMSELADTVGRLQKLINETNEFCDKWGMSVNIEKTGIMVLRRGGPLRQNEKWFYQNVPIQIVSHYKYLGILFSSRLSWGPAKQTLAMQSKKAMGFIKSVLKKSNTTIQILLNIFNRMVVPILCYGSEVWGYEHSKSIEQVQINFGKYLLGVNSATPSPAVLGELGACPLYICYFSKCIKYWCKLTQMSNERLPKASYNTLYDLDAAGYTTWATEIKNMLNSFGFGYVWMEQGVGDIDAFIHVFKQRISDNYIQQWTQDCNSMPKLQSYAKYKSELKFELYLSLDISIHIRSIFSRLRCGTLLLEIENGRHKGIPRELRQCPLCGIHVEDDYHFVMTCKDLNQ